MDDCYCKMWFDNRGGSLASTHITYLLFFFSCLRAHSFDGAVISFYCCRSAFVVFSRSFFLSLQWNKNLNNSFAYYSSFLLPLIEFEWCLWFRCCLEIESCWAVTEQEARTRTARNEFKSIHKGNDYTHAHE